jgi:hypothetical protein
MGRQACCRQNTTQLAMVLGEHKMGAEETIWQKGTICQTNAYIP